MTPLRNPLGVATLVLATAALVLSALAFIQGPGGTVTRPSWPPPPCDPNCAWRPLRTFTSAGGISDNVNITGSKVRAEWSASSGDLCGATLTVTFHHFDGNETGFDRTFTLVYNQGGMHSDIYNFPTGIPSGGIYPGTYGLIVGASNSCGGGWTWSVAIQEWR